MLLPSVSWGKRMVAADKPARVRLEVNNVTAVVFPEAVGAAAVALAETVLKIKQNGPYLYLMPTDADVKGRLFVIGTSGTQYQILFDVASVGDDEVYLTVAPHATAPVKAQPLTVSSLLRALVTNRPVPGQQATEPPVPTLPDTRVHLVDAAALALGETIGMILTVQNTH